MYLSIYKVNILHVVFQKYGYGRFYVKLFGCKKEIRREEYEKE